MREAPLAGAVLDKEATCRNLWKKVLVPYDFSSHATTALRLAADLAGAEQGRLLVLHVVPPFSRLIGVAPGFPPAAASSELVVEQQRRLAARVGRTLRACVGRRVSCRVTVDDPRRAILKAARDATVIVMGTLGLTGLPHLVIGSVAEKVVRHAPVPVLTVRTGARLRGLSPSHAPGRRTLPGMSARSCLRNPSHGPRR